MTTSSGWHRKDPTLDAERKKQYNSALHRRTRERMKRTVEAGTAHCWRCGTYLPPGTPFHAGHDDHDRSIYRGIECVPCNIGAAASKAARMVNAARAARAAGSAGRRRSTRTW